MLALAQSEPLELETLRTLLIQAGQLEQALVDAGETGAGLPRDVRVQAEGLTDLFAREFVEAWWGTQQEEPIPPTESFLSIRGHLEQLLTRASFPETELTFKTPEGFALYALFPEQYCAAALAWQGDPGRSVLVIGIRSIGTTLSAVVAAMLRQIGHRAARFTVRPFGHPFDREVTLPSYEFDETTEAMVVDEGPGASGSSMAAVARALQRRGCSRITFLPGHPHPPGTAGPGWVKDSWDETPRLVVPADRLHWNGKSLKDQLTARTAELLNEHGPMMIENVSAGLWRKKFWADPARWPAVCPRFERPKYLVSSAQGAVLWKFAGLGIDPDTGTPMTRRAQQLQNTLAQAGWTVPAIAWCSGYVASRWIAGEPLSDRAQADPEIIERLIAYITAAAGPALSWRAEVEGFERLREMILCNAREGLDEKAEQVASRLLGEVQDWFEQGWSRSGTGYPTYGDGHLSAHEWLRTAEGELYKVDTWGHTNDHTLVGSQLVFWDYAGAMVEWRQSRPFAKWGEFCRSVGIVPPPRKIARFYLLAYVLFRMGQTALAGDLSADPQEAERLRAAAEDYREQARGWIGNRSEPRA